MRAWPVLHRLGPVFLGAFRLRAVPAAASTLRAVELLRDSYASSSRKWPRNLPISFLRPVWRDAVLGAGGTEYRLWEAATLLALRDRLRAGDIWVEGSKQWRTVEDQLIPSALFAAMRDAGPLPVAVPATAEEYLAGRRALLDRRLAEVDAKAAAGRLEDVQIKGSFDAHLAAANFGLTVQPFEQRRRDVTLGERRNDRHDPLARHLRPTGHPQCGHKSRAG